MASAISHYTGIAKSTVYVYPGTDGTQSGTSVAKGTTLILKVDSNGSIVYENGLARTTSPVDGWVNAGNLSDITAVYSTVIDKCSPPTSLLVDRDSLTLTIKGGSGGDLNKFTGYRIRWRNAPLGTSAYGEWSESVAVTSNSTTVVFSIVVPDGYARQYAARTTGSAGKDYYSAYVIADELLISNHTPAAPVIMFPADLAETQSQTPVIVLNVPSDPDGDTVTLKRRVDNGAWIDVATLGSGAAYDKLPTLAAGNHTVRYKLTDVYAESSEVSVTFVVLPINWTRSIAAGDVISNKNISHRKDIYELLSAVNTQRLFYGLAEVDLPGMVGQFSMWKAQMEKLLESINEVSSATGQSERMLNVPSYPSAFVFNTIRKITTGTEESDFEVIFEVDEFCNATLNAIGFVVDDEGNADISISLSVDENGNAKI
ncbi:MAG: hypothetical protein J6T08_02660 [Lentisphaeria bacterium]|nr:hypothetical protein [Lentisphaeria bacterium]